MKVVLRCLMNLKKFPFDSQNCPLIIESWAYSTAEMKLSWENVDPVTIDEHLQLAEYSLVGINLSTTDTQYGKKTHNINNQVQYFSKDGKTFSTLAVNFALERQYGYYIMDFYMPSVFIVAVSWFTFWLEPQSTPARTTLGTATLLTLITLSTNMGNALPKVSYVKSSDIWFIVCTAFIFTSLAEFAFVNIVFRRRKNVDIKKVRGKYILRSAVIPRKYNTSSIPDNNRSDGPVLPLTLIRDGESTNTTTSNLSIAVLPDSDANAREQKQSEPSNLFTMSPQQIAQWIDKKSRLVFPLAFLVFNTLYWAWIFVLL